MAAVSAAKVIGLGEDDVRAVVVELAGLRDWSLTRFYGVIGVAHGLIVADLMGCADRTAAR